MQDLKFYSKADETGIRPTCKMGQHFCCSCQSWSRLDEEYGRATVLKISDSRSDNSGISFSLPLTMFMIGLVVASLPCVREFWPTRTQGSFPENSSNKLLRMFLSLHTQFTVFYQRCGSGDTKKLIPLLINFVLYIVL